MKLSITKNLISYLNVICVCKRINCWNNDSTEHKIHHAIHDQTDDTKCLSEIKIR